MTTDANQKNAFSWSAATPFVVGLLLVSACSKKEPDTKSDPGAARPKASDVEARSAAEPTASGSSDSASGSGDLTGPAVMAHVKTLKLPACLGEPEKLLACPPGMELWNGEPDIGCKTSRSQVQRGDFPRREGPSIWLSRREPTSIEAAKTFAKHKKQGREFAFYGKGALKGIYDWDNDEYHGMYFECYENGKPSDLQFRVHGKIQGVTRHWKESGELSSGANYVDDKPTKYLADFSPEERKKLAVMPADACQPKVCDLKAPPQFK